VKAAVWTDKDRLEQREMPEPQPQAHEALIKVLGCGVCGTDCHIYAGDVPLAKPPQVLGHEIFGEVVRTGNAVRTFSAGDTVCVDPVVGCGVCGYCKQGKSNLCVAPTIIGYARTGGFAQFTTVPETHLYHIASRVGVKGGILVETLACVLNGYDRLAPRAGGSALIVGAGCVGLLWAQLMLRSPITRLILAEIVEGRRAVARALGVKNVIDSSRPGWQKDVLAIEPEGVNYVIDATGVAQAIQESLDLLKPGGTFMIFGVCPQDERISVSPYKMFANELSIIGAKMPPHTLARAVSLIEAGFINHECFVTHVLPLSQLEHAIDMFHNAREEAVKIAIDPWA
jgi:2-desacetyl-2-hydroxyethyl bacteriochlorophyllide A dehydrogenase